jgi:DNA-binding transcriptional MocR family regulator
MYGLRRAALVEALHNCFRGRALVLGEAAGMHAYVRFHSSDIAAQAQRNKVQLREVSPCFLGKAPANDFLLGCSSVPERSLHEAIKRLAR